MDGKLQLYATLDKEYFSCKEIITGVVHLVTYDTLSLTSINFNLKKISDVRISTDKSKPKSVYSYNFDLFNAQGKSNNHIKLFSGHHKYPFKFYLKPEDSASCNFSFNINQDEIVIKNKYFIELKLMIFGIYLPILTTQKEINVIENFNFLGLQKIQKTNFEISSCFLFFRNHKSIETIFDKSLYYSGDNLCLKIKSHEPSLAHYVEAFLYQNIHYKIRNNNFLENNVVSKSSSKMKNGTCEIFLNLPIELQSTCKEEFFEIKYFITLKIKLQLSDAITIKRNMYVVRRIPKTPNDENRNVLSGIIEDPKFLSLV